MTEARFPLHSDSRGDLVVVEGSDVGFDVRRVFTVSGVQGGSTRGGHRPGCRELIVLASGSADVSVDRADGDATRHQLVEPGQGVHVWPSDRLTYDLHGSESVIMVLCDAPYEVVP